MKIIELADLHLDPKWLEQQKPCLNLILDTAKKEKPDFICIAGDIYNRAFYNSEKDCIKYVLDYFEELSKLSTVVMITGTPSHDAPGSYTVFEKIGCHILNPVWPEIINGCLFIGLHEIDKSTIINKVSSEQVNDKIKWLLEKYINEFWAPVREANKHLPCIFLGHGVFVDNPYDDNPIIKASDIVIDNNKLAEIKADRYIFGHFHIPGESKVLNGGYVGYAGFDRSPWNNTGFQPGFNVTEIEKRKPVIYDEPEKNEININEVEIFITQTTRIDYPVTRKEKIKCDNIKKLDNLDEYYKLPGCDFRINLVISKKELLKIDVNKLQDELKEKYNLNSCEIIPDIIKEESQRITHEQAEKLQTLWEKYCFFKGWNNLLRHGSFDSKITEIEKNVSLKTQAQETKKVKLLSLEVKGSIFSIDSQGKNSFSHDFSEDPTGLTLIAGDNGKGKSTYMGFASPYPIFIGWEYRSLKEFFPEEGYIKKKFDVNGKLHEHLIMISQKKIECYWYENTDTIPGKISKIKAVQLKDFMAECEKFFGPVTSFVSTSFFAQEPWRMEKYTSSLVSSTPTQLRNAYIEIVGISREGEKLYSRGKKDELNGKINNLEIEKSTMEKMIHGKEELTKKHNHTILDLNILDTEIGVIVHDENEKQKEFNNVEKEYNEQQKLLIEIHNLKNNLNAKNNDKAVLEFKIKNLEEINIDTLKIKLKQDDKIKSEIEKLREQWQVLNRGKNEILEDVKTREDALRIHEKQFNEITQEKEKLLIENRNIEVTIKLLNKPCFYCKKIDPENEVTINAYKKKIEENKDTMILLDTDIHNFSELITEFEKDIAQLKTTLPDEKLSEYEKNANDLKLQLLPVKEISAIQENINEYSKIKVYQENLEKVRVEIKELESKINELSSKKNPFIEQSYNDTKSELKNLQSQLQEKQNEIAEKKGTLAELKKQIDEISGHESRISEITNDLVTMKIDSAEWEEIEKDMQANKLPALELDIIAGEIDFAVNKKLNGKFIIKTNTQDINKDGDIIDRFDILVYNPANGIEKSLLKHSPGQRAAYFIEPISQALREQRQKREGVIFLWSIADETDNPIKFERVREYYGIMASGLPPDHTRFIMSQKSEIYQFIANTIDIEDIGKDM